MNRPRPTRLSRAQAVAITLIFACAPLAYIFQRATAQAPEPPPVQLPRSHNYDVQHYRIAVSFDWAKRSVAGETQVTLRPLQDEMKEVELDAGQMNIDSVKLAGGAPLKYRYEADEKLFVSLDRAYPVGGDVQFTISYTAAPKRGLTFITPTEDNPARPYQIWSQGEAQDNHYWFPCYDYPNDKATSEVIATVDERYQVISNGSLVEVRPDAAHKTKTWHWKMDQPFSVYLVSIIVGQYAEVREKYKNVPLVSYVYADEVENARVSIARLAPMIAFFSEKIGYDYPYAKYAQTTVRDFNGGMENITATTMSETLVHDRRAHLDLSSDSVVSHEIAHSWFGNLVTCSDWSHLWLNESYSEMFAALWTEHDRGQADYSYEMYGNQQQYLHAWALGARRPIVTRRYYDPDALFDTYVYPRGAAVLDMLRYVLGDEAFFKATTHYVKKYQWQLVDTQQLVAAIEEATGQNVQWFIDEWVYRMGHPEFEISSSYDAGAGMLKLRVKQTQKPARTLPWFDSTEFFTMPVDIAITTAAGERVHRVLIDRAEKEFAFAVDSKPLIVNFDRGNRIIKQVKFPRSDDELSYQLLHDADVMGRVLAAVELRSRHSERASKAIAEAAVGDKFWGVRLEAARGLSEFKTDAARRALIEAAGDKESRIRRAAIQGLATLKDPALAALYINVIRTDQSYYAVAEAARALGLTADAGAYEVLVNALKQDSYQDVIRIGALEGLAALGNNRALEAGFKYAARVNPINVRVSAFQLIAGTGKGSDRAFEILSSALKDASLRIRIAAVQALGTLGDKRAISILEEVLKAPDLSPVVRMAVVNALNQVKGGTK
jgi:aminopeptidase N